MQAKDEQDEMKEEVSRLENYNPTNKQKINSKEEVFDNGKGLFNIRISIIKAFENGMFPLHKENLHKEQAKEEKKEKKEETIPDWIKIEKSCVQLNKTKG